MRKKSIPILQKGLIGNNNIINIILTTLNIEGILQLLSLLRSVLYKSTSGTPNRQPSEVSILKLI